MQERNSQRTNPGLALQFKTLKFLCLIACLIMKIKELQSHEIYTTEGVTNFCYNSSLEGSYIIYLEKVLDFCYAWFVGGTSLFLKLGSIPAILFD